ncbi:E3 ubiquitin protein ligase RIE1 [Acorus calamus]|uniref:RING-type E3 ubiquitin transferase n=1 Tax=Acorus calamus TaxID=4465 RepID=A0AAV9EMJ7_ACOCL|nr:E3 ubiquitin protein ligase RIE1 [Acorus calamus]
MDETLTTSPATIDGASEPLLERTPRPADPATARAASLAAVLGRVSGRGRGPQMMVRETAALQLDERRADWGYSKPVVALDVLWNLSFAAASVVVLSLSVRERPVTPIRLWICGYAFQCLVHVSLVWAEYRRRNAHGQRRGGSGGVQRSEEEEEGGRGASGTDIEANEGGEDEDGNGRRFSHDVSSFTKRCESINTMASILWWIIGFYWVVSGSEVLLQNAPRLYWLAVVFLAFDVIFAVLCVSLAFMIGIALCCCLPCIIGILYALAGQEGASDADISLLLRYKFCRPSNNGQKATAETGVMIPIATNNGFPAEERVIALEDAECCICISPYEGGVEIHELPCNHHFHSSCIIKWLRINATCPLCKYNILKGNDRA